MDLTLQLALNSGNNCVQNMVSAKMERLRTLRLKVETARMSSSIKLVSKLFIEYSLTQRPTMNIIYRERSCLIWNRE